MQLEQPLGIYSGNPQVEDGHTKIANELLEAIILHNFSKRQFKVILFIIRKTYGFNKKSDDIARSQIVEATGLLSPHITTTLSELKAMNVVHSDDGKYAKHYRLNKKYDEWKVTETVITKTVTITETVINAYQNGNFHLPKQYPQKTTPKYNTKDIPKAEKKPSVSVTLKMYLEQCKLSGIKPIPEDDAVFKLCDDMNIDQEWAYLAWRVFVSKYKDTSKKYKSWRKTFYNCVHDNWYKIWAKDNAGNTIITSQGKLLMDAHGK